MFKPAIDVFKAKDLTRGYIEKKFRKIIHTQEILVGWKNHDSPIYEKKEYIERYLTVVKIKKFPELDEEDGADRFYNLRSHPLGCLLLGVSRVVECGPDSYTLLVTDPKSIHALCLFEPLQTSILKITDTEYLVGVVTKDATIWNADRTQTTKDVLTTASYIAPLLFPRVVDGVLQWALYQAMLKRETTEPVPALLPFKSCTEYRPFTFPPHTSPPRPDITKEKEKAERELMEDTVYKTLRSLQRSLDYVKVEGRSEPYQLIKDGHLCVHPYGYDTLTVEVFGSRSMFRYIICKINVDGSSETSIRDIRHHTVEAHGYYISDPIHKHTDKRDLVNEIIRLAWFSMVLSM